MPTYLAGLNSSFATNQTYDVKTKSMEKSNSVIVLSYDDLTFGSSRNYLVQLIFSEDAKHGMCQGYDIPNKIESPFSKKLDPVLVIGKW